MSERALVDMRRGISLYKAFPRVSDFRLLTEAVSARCTWYRSCNIRLLFTRGVSAIRRSSSVVLFRCSIPPPSTFSHVTYLRVFLYEYVGHVLKVHFFFSSVRRFCVGPITARGFHFLELLHWSFFFIGKPDTWIQASKRSLCWFVRKILELSCISLPYTLSTPIDTTS